MTDHAKSCQLSTGKQTLINSFVKRKPGIKLAESERLSVKDSEVHLVVEAGVAFAIVSNQGFRNFAQQMISIGSKHGNIDIDDVLYGPHTVRQAVSNKMRVCQDLIKKVFSQVPNTAQFHSVPISQLMM